MIGVLGLGIWIAIASLIAATLVAWDKGAARGGRRRVAERNLLAWSLLGGWPGAWLAGRLLRHKTRKRSFRLRFAACVAGHLLATGALLWLSV